MGLFFDVLRLNLACFGVDGDLPRNEDQVVEGGDGGVGADGLGDALRVDSLYLFHNILSNHILRCLSCSCWSSPIRSRIILAS